MSAPTPIHIRESMPPAQQLEIPRSSPLLVVNETSLEVSYQVVSGSQVIVSPTLLAPDDRKAENPIARDALFTAQDTANGGIKVTIKIVVTPH